MDSKERARMIRRGNQALNSGDLRLALELFIKSRYMDGLVRIADLFLYKKGDVGTAYRIYKKAGYRQGLEKAMTKIIGTIRWMLSTDRIEESWLELDASDPVGSHYLQTKRAHYGMSYEEKLKHRMDSNRVSAKGTVKELDDLRERLKSHLGPTEQKAKS